MCQVSSGDTHCSNSAVVSPGYDVILTAAGFMDQYPTPPTLYPFQGCWYNSPHLINGSHILGLFAIPPCACFFVMVAIKEAAQSYDSCHDEHHGVETQPGKVNADLLPKVLPVQGNQTL